MFSMFCGLVSFNSYAAVVCHGKVKDIYKWHNFETISFRLEMADKVATKWIGLPGKSEESMVLLAFASNKDVAVYYSEDSVTSCVNGWGDNKVIKGYLKVH